MLQISLGRKAPTIEIPLQAGAEGLWLSASWSQQSMLSPLQYVRTSHCDGATQQTKLVLLVVNGWRMSFPAEDQPTSSLTITWQIPVSICLQHMTLTEDVKAMLTRFCKEVCLLLVTNADRHRRRQKPEPGSLWCYHCRGRTQRGETNAFHILPLVWSPCSAARGPCDGWWHTRNGYSRRPWNGAETPSE